MTREPQHTSQGLTIFIDGECPLCRREARLLKRLDRRRGRLRIVDITDPSFKPSRDGRSIEQMMISIHGRLPDGTMVSGMEVFRRAYAAVGLGWLLAPTAWPGLRQLFDRLYAWFARNRTRLSGRATDGSGQSQPEAQPVPASDRHP
jgi:predicted DCC family thiol-disulfide oxidoreductase YuxK